MTNDAPASYDELFVQYFGYVQGLVRKLGIRENEDIAQEIMVRFIARGGLEMYDPTMTGHGKPTNFKAFLRAWVERYSRHYRERQGVRDVREPLHCDKEVSPGRLWVEIYQTPHYDDFDLLEEGEIVVLVRERLAEVPNRGARDLLRLFDLMLPQIRSYGRIDRKELAKQYGVSESVVGSMIREMRDALSYLSPAL